MIHTNGPVIDQLINCDLIETLITGLNERDPEIVFDCLDCIYMLITDNDKDITRIVIKKLELMNGNRSIENLQIHKNPKIYERSLKILESLLEFEQLEKIN